MNLLHSCFALQKRQKGRKLVEFNHSNNQIMKVILYCLLCIGFFLDLINSKDFLLYQPVGCLKECKGKFNYYTCPVKEAIHLKKSEINSNIRCGQSWDEAESSFLLSRAANLVIGYDVNFDNDPSQILDDMSVSKTTLTPQVDQVWFDVNLGVGALVTHVTINFDSDSIHKNNVKFYIIAIKDKWYKPYNNICYQSSGKVNHQSVTHVCASTPENTRHVRFANNYKQSHVEPVAITIQKFFVYGKITCESDKEFPCLRDPKCIPKEKVNDGDLDCMYGEDEVDKVKKEIPKYESCLRKKSEYCFSYNNILNLSAKESKEICMKQPEI